MTEGSSNCPVWVSDYADIQNLLSSFLDKLDKRQARLLIRLTPKIAPTLFDYNHPDSPMIWAVIQSLEREFDVLSIEPDKKRRGGEIFDNAQLRFHPNAESVVRTWLNRPKIKPYPSQWQEAVQQLTWRASSDVAFIESTPLAFSDKSADEMAAKLNALERQLDQPHTHRALSAMLFWGDSKFLEGKEHYLDKAFPQHRIQQRPIIVNIYLPEAVSSVLFIENQDSFLMLAKHLMNASENSDVALVYTAGFRGAASRIRAPSSYLFSTLAQASSATLETFKQWWEGTSNQTIPCYFWGDLDFAGCAILAALKIAFTELCAWPPAYEVMLEHLEQGNAHTFHAKNKGEQKDPGQTGCAYTDDRLLPAIRRHGHYVDQEVVSIKKLS